MLKFEGLEVKWVKSTLPVIVLLFIVGILSLPFVIPSTVYQDLIETRLEESTGLNIEFQGPFSLSLFPSVRIEAEDIEFSGNLVSGVDSIGSINRLLLDMDTLQVFTGNININEFLLENPEVTINGDFTTYLPDWFRNNLSTARKEDIRYLEIILHFIENSVFNIAKISEGTIQWNKTPDDQISAQKLNISVEKPKEGRDFTIDGNDYINDRSVDLAMRLQRPDDFLRGFRSKLTMELDSAPLKIEFTGNAAHRQSFVAQGLARIQVPSVFEFCTWFNHQSKCDDNSGDILIKSDLKLRDQRLQIEDTSYSNDDFTFTVNGAIDFKPVTPEIIGNILVPPRPFDSMKSSYSRILKTDFNNLLLDTFDANVDLKYQGLTLPSGDVLTPKVKFLLNDGHLSINSDKISLFGGLSNFRLRWHKGLDDGYMDLRFDTHSLDLKSLQFSKFKLINGYTI